MTIDVSITNLAASKIGEDDQLASPDDDTVVGRAVRAVWDVVRTSTLRDHPWNFALRRQSLAAQVLDQQPYGYTSSFKLPPDCLRVVELLIRLPRDDWQVEGGAVLTNCAGPLPIRYVADVQETSLWDATFIEAFACRLAFQIADRITGDRARKTDMWQSYQEALSQAKRVDSRERPPLTFEPTDWETARFSGPGFGPPNNIPLGYPT